ncbi:hypothetical protein NIES2109_55700 (plasmid) [Nostoc sp. HK-01]|nr:hypothetical protein NIES2109_55700 [Nostoc sp. HK-01]
MIDRNDIHSGLRARQKIVGVFKKVSWLCFWLQLVLAAVSILILLFAIADPNFNINLKSGLGLLSTFGGISALGLGVYWTFHYTRIAQRLQVSEPGIYPSRKEVVRDLHIGITIHFVGVLLTLIATQVVVGALLVKVITLSPGMTIYQSRQLIEPLDIFVVQASILMNTALFIGIGCAFWLLKQINHSQT